MPTVRELVHLNFMFLKHSLGTAENWCQSFLIDCRNACNELIGISQTLKADVEKWQGAVQLIYFQCAKLVFISKDNTALGEIVRGEFHADFIAS